MMYFSFGNDAYHLFHYFLSLCAIFLLLPLVMFEKVSGTAADRVAANVMRMTLFIISTGYVLVLTKLYEVLGFVLCLVVWMLLRRVRDPNRDGRASSMALVFFFDLVEGRFLWSSAKASGQNLMQRTRRWMRGFSWRWDPSFLFGVLVIAALAVSLAIRGYDALVHAAPAMSDGYVTLAWMKYVSERYLFHDGLYPQGFYFYLSMVDKLAFINPLYVLRYTGPIDAFLIVVGMYYAIVRWTGDRVAGFTAVMLYGVLGQTVLGDDWMRQAATNSQEFAFMFVLPTMYFVSRYMRDGARSDLLVSGAGLCVIGMSHPMPYVLVCLGTVALAAASAIYYFEERQARIWTMALVGVVSSVAALLPLGIGMLLGKAVNSSSQSFITGTAATAVTLPPLHPVDYAALAATALMLVGALIEGAAGKKPVLWLAIGIWSVFVFGLNEFGGPLTRSTVLLSRTLDLWAVTEVTVIAMGIVVLNQLLPARLWIRWLETAIVVGGSATALYLFPVEAIIPYKMQWEAAVDQYLKINSTYRYNYMIVGQNEFYDLVLGSGFHEYTATFLQQFDPTKQPLTNYGQSKPNLGLSPNIFLVYQKHIFEVDKKNSIYPLEKPIYEAEQQNRTRMKQWIQTYRAHHYPLTVYYNGPNLTIYLIHPKQQSSTQTNP